MSARSNFGSSHFASSNTLSKLEDPCEEIREGSKSQRKLLRHGIVPGGGAKLPAHIRTSGGKRC